MKQTNNLRIREQRALILPALLLDELPTTADITDLVLRARDEAKAIIHGQDDCLLAIVGPCSIHDPAAALDYAKQLKPLADEISGEIKVIMRVYFEKPRTTVGWKGLINDPHLDESFEINQGLRIARQLLLDINTIGVATGSEFLDTTIPQYIADLIAWSAIGARTVESQIHRELASGLSMPVGFKNGTTGNTQIAVDAVLAAKEPHHFLGVSREGIAAILSTTGNTDCHVILRGSNHATNYDEKSISATVSQLKKESLAPRVMVDCSHGNSRKDHRNQIKVAESLSQQIEKGSKAILGVMIESNLVAGKQSLTSEKSLTYGQSITDACIDLNETRTLLNRLAEAVKKRRKFKEGNA